ncbi:MAG: hypothetical protein RL398_3663 [Planctomycetota bacterium]|jgi:hypothetical protein
MTKTIARRPLLLAGLFGVVSLLPACGGIAARGEPPVDVCVYGATSAGVVAAIELARQGRSVTLIDADGWIGGLSTSGLGATDVGNKDAIGGIAREFYRRLKAHYSDAANWTAERPADFKGRGHHESGDAAWTFEPKAATAVFDAMLAEHGIVAVRTRLDRGPGGVEKQGGKILRIRCEDGSVVDAKMFLDCTYEGDLFAAAGCSFIIGRESNAAFGETLNGVQVQNATKHQFTLRVDPYVVPGDPASGLLPHVQAGGPGVEGSGDHRMQAYCFRICSTDDPANRIAWRQPDGYDDKEFEVLFRYFEAGSKLAPWHPVWMPNRKTDTNNNGAFSTDYLGANYDYPAASYAEREAIVQEHRRYQEALLWTLANHPRVPEKVRAEFSRFGLAKDEFVGNDHWPPLLYIREGRRLLGEHVVHEGHCMGRAVDPDPVGMGAYAMDSHNVQRYVAADGSVRNEGDVQVRVPQPYGISYRAMTPRRGEADNLLVPVSLSATHIAFGSIRMEPVFMVLAQSAAIAAGLALEQGKTVQDVAYGELQPRLLAAGQVLTWPTPKR